MKKLLVVMVFVICLLFVAGVPQLIADGPGGDPSGAPEIDPGTASSAIGLLVGGLLMLSARRRRTKISRTA
jgi:hypothetical protein